MGFTLGALLYVWGFAALFRRVARKLLKAERLGRWAFATSYMLAWLASIPVVAYGFADGGPPQWIFAVTAYLPAAVLGFVATLTATAFAAPIEPASPPALKRRKAP